MTRPDGCHPSAPSFRFCTDRIQAQTISKSLQKEELGSLRTPKSIDFIDSIPRSSNGKVLKRELRDRYWMGFSRKV
jgi:acyl-CoA synthetase (AMP-forming)/AMP-acid ligase II